MEWNQLLSSKRFRESIRTDIEPLIARNEFEADYDRIIGSSSVRRLQDKAQVFPLQEDDVARTRLTHSIEVSALARSLGKAVGKQLEAKSVFNPDDTDKLAAILQTAGLVHDLGNPPFGHYGETVIRNWFRRWFREGDGKSLINRGEISVQQKNDFLNFDGNVQNLRILTKLQTQNDNFGANFTFATLSSIIKYPFCSTNTPSGKFGYFSSENDQYSRIISEVGLNPGVRHPATYLLEAADDIIYLCDDIEDGVKKGYIDWEKEYQVIKRTLSVPFRDMELQKVFRKIESKAPDKNLSSREREIASSRNFRNYIQSYMFRVAVKNFLDNLDKIMSNTVYDRMELLSTESALVSELKRVTKSACYSCKEVISLELMGETVLSKFLDDFVPAISKNCGKVLLDMSTREGKLFSLISENFVYTSLYPHLKGENLSNKQDKEHLIDELTKYEKIQLVVDYVSGMTDTYALNLYQQLAAIRRPI